jgi:hypothetical protein
MRKVWVLYLTNGLYCLLDLHAWNETSRLQCVPGLGLTTPSLTCQSVLGTTPPERVLS